MNLGGKERFLGVLLGIVYTGCQAAPATPESVLPTPAPTATRGFTGGKMYDGMWDLLASQRIFYNTLLGHAGRETDKGYNPFYQDKTEYLRFNGDELPCTMFFRFENGGGFTLANCDGFIGTNTFQLSGAGDPAPSICAPFSDKKRDLYRKLMDDFRFDQEADRDLIGAIMRGATPDCGYFLDIQSDKPLPPKRGEFRIKG
ncbi:hypothetical protein HYU96_04740 [Candidatus Daviesbacteria bacterium]|nr:hypothetical protein [Candidatus Daviesbacteria bacterium]